MAITEIPEFVEAAPSDLIRSQDLNNVQRQVRNSVRTHRHTRVAGAPVDDAATADLALQITTDEIPDQAVTAAKLADGAVTSGKLANGAVTGPRLADNAVGTTKILNGSISTEKLQADAVTSDKIRNEVVNLPKLDLQQVEDGSQGLSAGSSTTPTQGTVDVLAGLTTALSTIFFRSRHCRPSRAGQPRRWTRPSSTAGHRLRPAPELTCACVCETVARPPQQ